MSQNHRYLQFIIGAAKANRFMNFRHIEKPYSHGEKFKKTPISSKKASHPIKNTLKTRNTPKR